MRVYIQKSLSGRHFYGTICTYIYSFGKLILQRITEKQPIYTLLKSDERGVDSHAKNVTILQSRAEQSRAEQSRAEQSRAEQSRAWASCGLFSDKIIYNDG